MAANTPEPDELPLRSYWGAEGFRLQECLLRSPRTIKIIIIIDFSKILRLLLTLVTSIFAIAAVIWAKKVPSRTFAATAASGGGDRPVGNPCALVRDFRCNVEVGIVREQYSIIAFDTTIVIIKYPKTSCLPLRPLYYGAWLLRQGFPGFECLSTYSVAP